MNPKRYGMVGWQEFASNRTEILTKYNIAKARESSRPIKTERGVVGEAAIREWLAGFLPAKYGVTSGYIIPDLVQTPEYKLYHHDVIIFDALNSPVLWTEENADQSALGKRRAIPAKYVHAVLEVKATFGKETAIEALVKLRQLNLIAPHFPTEFSCATIFIELPISQAPKSQLLEYLLPNPPILAFWGGLILHCELNAEMSGEISFLANGGGLGSAQNVTGLPLAKDIDTLDIFIDSDGNCKMAEAAGGVKLVSDGISSWMVSKLYCPTFCSNDVCVNLSWSANGFSQFALDLLNRLEGKNRREDEYRFGQVFDHLERRE